MSDERPVCFLDVDGVCNRWANPPSPLLCEPECVAHLNRILEETNAVVVLSSSLRELVHSESMTLDGMAWALRSHGIWCELVGVTETDDDGEPDLPLCRGEQIRLWRRQHAPGCRYVVLDDVDDGISARGLNFVKTNGSKGLTAQDAERAVALMRG